MNTASINEKFHSSVPKDPGILMPLMVSGSALANS